MSCENTLWADKKFSSPETEQPYILSQSHLLSKVAPIIGLNVDVIIVFRLLMEKQESSKCTNVDLERFAYTFIHFSFLHFVNTCM